MEKNLIKFAIETISDSLTKIPFLGAPYIWNGSRSTLDHFDNIMSNFLDYFTFLLDYFTILSKYK